MGLNTSSTTATMLYQLNPIKAEVTEKMNADFELRFSVLSSHQLEKYDLISAKTPRGYQLFRIASIDANGKTADVIARHVFFDLASNFSLGFKAAGVVPTTMITRFVESLVEPNIFTFKTEIATGQTNSYNPEEAPAMEVFLNGERSVVGILGVELLRDNYTVTLKKRIGIDKHYILHPKRNIIDLKKVSGADDVCTKIILRGGTEEKPLSATITSPIADKYPRVFVRKYENNDEEINSVEKLINWGKLKFTTEQIDVPKVSFEFEIIDEAIDVDIGDTVLVRVKELGIDVRSKCTGYEYSPLDDRYTKLYFGEQTSVSTAIGNIVTGIVKPAVDNTTDNLQGQIDAANKEIEKEAEALKGEIEDARLKAEADVAAAGQALRDGMKGEIADFENDFYLAGKAVATLERVQNELGVTLEGVETTLDDNSTRIGALTTNYETVNNTVSSHSTTLGSLTTWKNGADQRMSTIEQTASSITSTVTANVTANNYVAMIATGNPLKLDVAFDVGLNGISPYNNLGNKQVTVVREARETTSPTTGLYQLRISTIGSATPGLGGFVHMITSRPSAVFVQHLIAKIPIGYTLNAASNDYGTGGRTYFVGSAEGTGHFETYYIVRECGETGVFSTTGHVYLTAKDNYPKTVEWVVSYASIIDVTNSQLVQTITEYGSKITQTANKISLLVTDGSNASGIALTPNALTAIASQINLTGNVFFKSLLDSGLTQINGGMIKTNTIKASTLLLDKSLVVDGTIKANHITSVEAEIYQLFSKIIKADYIEANHVKINKAFIDKLVTNTLFVETLKAQKAFITVLQSVSINASQITTGILKGGSLSWDLTKSYLSFSAASNAMVYSRSGNSAGIKFGDMYSSVLGKNVPTVSLFTTDSRGTAFHTGIDLLAAEQQINLRGDRISFYDAQQFKDHGIHIFPTSSKFGIYPWTANTGNVGWLNTSGYAESPMSPFAHVSAMYLLYTQGVIKRSSAGIKYITNTIDTAWALNAVNNTPVKRYFYKDSNYQDVYKSKAGIIIDDIRPEPDLAKLLLTYEDGMEFLDADNVTYLLWSAVQQLSKEVLELRELI